MELHPNAATDSLGVAGDGDDAARAPRRMTTDRLVLRRAHPDEVAIERLHDLFAAADPDEVFALCGWDEHASAAETRAYLERMAEHWTRGDRLEYVLEGPTGEYVGTTCIEVAADGDGELALWLRKPSWGRGFCGEATDALLHAAFERLQTPYVVAGCLPANERSRRAIESFVGRYGGAYYGSPPVVSSGGVDADGDGTEGVRSETDGDRTVPHHEWVVTREQFAAGDRGLSCTVPGVTYEDLEF